MAAPIHAGDQRFPRERRILRKREFELVFKEGRKVVRPSLVVFIRQREQPHLPTRLGLTVSRKVGKANVRNLLKRRLRDVFRRNHPNILAGLDIVVTARKGVENATFDTIRNEFLASLRKARALHEETAPCEPS